VAHPQHEDGVGDVQVLGIVGVAGIGARRRPASEEERLEDGDRVADVDAPRIVAVPAHKLERARYPGDLDLRVAKDGRRRLLSGHERDVVPPDLGPRSRVVPALRA